MNELTKKYGMNVIAGLVILFVGMGIGSMISRKGSLMGGEDTYQAGWDAAKKRLSESGFGFPAAVEVMNVSGTVQEVSSTGMTIKIRPVEPLSDPALDVRTVTFDANTKFYQMKQKDPVQYQQEIRDFNAKIQSLITKSGTQAPPIETPPQPFIKTPVTAQDIKKDTLVAVTAGSNIKDTKTFVATEVSIQQAPVVPPTAAPAPVVR